MICMNEWINGEQPSMLFWAPPKCDLAAYRGYKDLVKMVSPELELDLSKDLHIDRLLNPMPYLVIVSYDHTPLQHNCARALYDKGVQAVL